MRTTLTSLERLEAQIRALPDGTPQGAAWEEALVRWVNGGGHPDLVKGWGWKQWPGRAKAGLPRIERGVDLIAEDRAGRLVAIQAKFRNDPDSPVKTGEVQKFVGAYRKHFPRRMLISNASSRARGIKEAVGDGEAELVLRTDLSESLFDWIASKPLPRPKVTPLPFQKEAAAAIKKHLKDGGRAQIVMACGSGKTYTTLLAMEALGSKRVLVLAPTLLLVKQLRDEWMRERTNTWATLAVCSDIGTNEGDDSTHVSPGEIGSKPTTDPAEIAIFLKSKGPYVVFGTYASSARIATAQKKAGVPAFDLVVADEAHRIAGAVGKADKEERAQRVVLDETGIRAQRRLFATATPRVYGGDKKKDGEEIVLESMDDPARFGEEVYKLTFQQAVDLKRLVPYKLLVTIVTNEEVQALIHDRVYLDVQGKKITIDDLATAIAVRRAYKELGISRVISYHGNIKRARAFAQLVQEVKAPGKAPETECVTGAMPVEDRKEALSRLANAEGPYLITNARCLTEGIDVPALDAVAFVDPRKSQVDIVQAVGRAMRKPRGTSSKTTGYIILPVFLSKADLKDPEAAVESSAFAPVLQVLRALKSHDPYRAPFFAKVLVEQGKRPQKKGEGIDEILQISIGKELDRALAKRLEQAVQLRAVEVAADSFEIGLEFLRAFIAQNGQREVKTNEFFEGFNLGQWVIMARSRKRGTRSPTLNHEQIDSLETMGFSWEPFADRWEYGLQQLESWMSHHAGFPREDEQYSGFSLGTWIGVQRSNWRRHTLSVERKNRLDALGFVWDTRSTAWDKGFQMLLEYRNEHGHVRVHDDAIFSNYRLGNWVTTQRGRFRKGTIPTELIAKLTAIGFEWEPRTKARDIGLAMAKAHIAEGGSLDIPNTFVYGKYPLGQWVANRRSEIKNGTASRLTVALLTKHGIATPVFDTKWNRKLTALQKWMRKHPGKLPKKSEMQDGENVGGWMAEQINQARAGALTSARLASLSELGVPFNRQKEREQSAWDVGLLALQKYVAREGHALVPSNWREQTFKLGQWVSVQRSRLHAETRGTRRPMSTEEIAALDEIGFVWNTLDNKWSKGLSLLKNYAQEKGDTNVPGDFVTDGFELGSWVRNLRSHRDKLATNRVQELNQVGMIWEVNEWLWDQGVSSLRTYIAEHGHSRVPVSGVFQGFKLGQWLAVRRREKKNGKLSVAREKQLKSLGVI